MALGLSAVACLLSVIVSGLTLAPTGRLLVDWVTYANAVDRFTSGQGLYAPAQLAGPYFLPDVVRVGYAYPPPSILLLVPFTSYPVGLIAWTIVNVGLLLTGLVAVIRKELGRVTPLSATAMLGGLALFVPFGEGVATGNVNCGLAGILAWAWVIGRSDPRIGLLAGLGAVIKVVPGALVFWSDRRTFIRTAAIAVAVAAGVSVAMFPITGSGAWTDFVTALGGSRPNCALPGIHPSLVCVIDPIAGSESARWMAIVIALVAGAGAVLARTPMVSFALVVVALLAPATDGHSHSWLPLYVILVVVASRTMARRSLLSSRDPVEGTINLRPRDPRELAANGYSMPTE